MILIEEWITWNNAGSLKGFLFLRAPFFMLMQFLGHGVCSRDQKF
jgi:hypothetical protein